jgi:ribosome assembly protein YihI (activator of Der GTPase)
MLERRVLENSESGSVSMASTRTLTESKDWMAVSMRALRFPRRPIHGRRTKIARAERDAESRSPRPNRKKTRRGERRGGSRSWEWSCPWGRDIMFCQDPDF